MKKYFYTYISGFLSCAVVTFALYWYCRPAPTPPKPPVMIAQQGETQHTTIITPMTCEDLRKAAASPIEIQRRIEYPFLFISASDGYKKAEVKDKLEINQKEAPKNIIFALGGVGFYGLPFYSIGAGYMRRVWGPVMIGGSAAFMPGGFGVNVLAGVTF